MSKRDCDYVVNMLEHVGWKSRVDGKKVTFYRGKEEITGPECAMLSMSFLRAAAEVFRNDPKTALFVLLIEWTGLSMEEGKECTMIRESYMTIDEILEDAE